MKTIIISILILFLAVATTPQRVQPIATARMNGLGYYLLTNYQIDNKHCLNFYDGGNKYNHFCGVYYLRKV